MAYNSGFSLPTQDRIEFIDITSRIQDLVTKSKIHSGIAVVFAPHTTAAITINENADPDVTRDLAEFCRRQVPAQDYYQHQEGNSPAHILSSLFSASETIIIQEGRLALGTWQAIYFCEFDGPRQRQFYCKIIAD